MNTDPACPNSPRCGEPTRAETFAGLWCACERRPQTDHSKGRD